MSNITLKMKDGTTRHFPYEGRAGGSWTKTLRFEGGFVIITDEWQKQTAFPAEDIAEIIQTPDRGSW